MYGLGTGYLASCSWMPTGNGPNTHLLSDLMSSLSD